jgi:hypothetical protein
MFGACFGRISDSRLSKRASGDSNLTSSMPSTVGTHGSAASNGRRPYALERVYRHWLVSRLVSEALLVVTPQHDWPAERRPKLVEPYA